MRNIFIYLQLLSFGFGSIIYKIIIKSQNWLGARGEQIEKKDFLTNPYKEVDKKIEN